MELALQTKAFDQAVAQLPEYFRTRLLALPEPIRAKATEVRLRAGGTLSLSLPDGPLYVTQAGRATAVFCEETCLCLTQTQLAECVRALSGYSLHSCTEDLAHGFLTLPGGHRAGLCGTAVLQAGQVHTLRQLSSINLRIARACPGVASPLVQRLYSGGQLPSLLLAGAPGSGKTTLLRDLCHQLSSGKGCPPRRVALLDERGELAAMNAGKPGFSIGANTDVLSGYPKAVGMLQALRSLAPEVIVCDELGDPADAEAILAGVGAGVQFIATLHAGSIEEALQRPVVLPLLRANAFAELVLLQGARQPCVVQQSRSLRSAALQAVPCRG